MITFMYTSRRGKLIYSDTKQISGCLGGGETQKDRMMGHKEAFRGWLCSYLDCGRGFVGVDLCQNVSNHTL